MTELYDSLSKLDTGTAINIMRKSGKIVSGTLEKVTTKAAVLKVDGKRYPPIQLAQVSEFELDSDKGNGDAQAQDIADGKQPVKAPPKKKAASKAKPKAAEKPTGKAIVGTFAAHKVDPRHISIREGWNPRIDMGDIKELAASIQAQGVREPLLLRRTKQGLEVVEGHRRMEAVNILLSKGIEVPWVPAIMEERGADEATLLVHSLVNNSGKPLMPLEECDAFKRLQEEGYDVKRISAETGKSAAYIRSRLVLEDAGPALQKAIRDGLNVKTASHIAKQEKDPDKQAKMVEDVAVDRKEAKQKRQQLARDNREQKKQEKEREREERVRKSGKFDFSAAKVLLGDVASAYMKWTRAEEGTEEEEQLYTEFHEIILKVRQHKRNGDLKVKTRR